MEIKNIMDTDNKVYIIDNIDNKERFYYEILQIIDECTKNKIEIYYITSNTIKRFNNMTFHFSYFKNDHFDGCIISLFIEEFMTGLSIREKYLRKNYDPNHLEILDSDYSAWNNPKDLFGNKGFINFLKGEDQNGKI